MNMASRIHTTSQFPLERAPTKRRRHALASAPGQRQPRKRHGSYLDKIRKLPCLISGITGQSEAAHVRFGAPDRGKRPTGMAEKPDDRWTVPLSAHWHRLAAESQHQNNERDWWNATGIDPVALCKLLWDARNDFAWMEEIVDMHRPATPPYGAEQLR